MMGLGTTAGGLNRLLSIFKRWVILSELLGAIRDAQLDLSKRWQFRAMGVDNPDEGSC